MPTSVSGTVFLVDDDDDFRESMQWLLESADLRVSAYCSAQAFLDTYQGEPGCLLIDVRMPEISGLALQQMLRSRGIDLPTIIMTGHGDIPMAVSAMKNGALDFLEKPFDDEVMLQQVRQALSLAAEQQQARQQDGVITSYSIHYTKLYEDPRPCAGSAHLCRGSGSGLPARHRHPALPVQPQRKCPCARNNFV